MNKNTNYISIDEVLLIHEKLIKKFGGAIGVRDLGLIESALHRPQSGYYSSVSLQAAAVLESFSLNHCFIDGNKIVALTVCVVFLKLNGLKIQIPKKVFAYFIIEKVIKEKVGVEYIAKWLEQYFQ